MTTEKMAAWNGRKIYTPDKVFAVNMQAIAMATERGADAVTNATIGTLMDDDGKLLVLSSVHAIFQSLHPEEYAAYAPIGGTAEFQAAAKQAALGLFLHRTKRHIAAVATMGGTGALRNAISNYSLIGDSVLIPDWHWATYDKIATEAGRAVETFPLFDAEGRFDRRAFSMKVRDILERQNRLVIILNTPANNPTGYALTKADWEDILSCMEEQNPASRIALVIDTAYIDFAGEEEEVRGFLEVVERMPAQVLPILACSFSKTLTMYGLRTGAMICLALTEEIAEEFRLCAEYSSRATWSNPTRAGQSIVEKIYADPALLRRVDEERGAIRNMLLRRGRTFEEAARDCRLPMLPFMAGFFCTLPAERPDVLCAALAQEGIFTVPLAKGLRVSIASVPEKACRTLPARICAVMDRI